MCTERKQTPAYTCECNRGGAPYFDASGGGGFLNFWQFLFGSPLKQPSVLHVLPFLPRSGFAASPFCLSPGLASILRRLSRHCPRFFAVVPVETMRARFHNIEQSFISGLEGRDACGEGKQNVRQLLNVAGAAAPCWVDFAGVVIEDNWEQSPRGTARTVGSFCACIRPSMRARARMCERRHGRMTVAHLHIDSCTWRLWISTWGENTEGILELSPRMPGLFAVLIYINIHARARTPKRVDNAD